MEMEAEKRAKRRLESKSREKPARKQPTMAGSDEGGGGREPRMWVAYGSWKRQGNGIFLRAPRKEHIVILAQRGLC